MTDEDARTAANVVLVAAAVAAAYLVLSKPPLRRLAFRAVQLWLGATVPAFLLNEAREAWVESGSPHA
jgi:hypothetical protein